MRRLMRPDGVSASKSVVVLKLTETVCGLRNKSARESPEKNRDHNDSVRLHK